MSLKYEPSSEPLHIGDVAMLRFNLRVRFRANHSRVLEPPSDMSGFETLFSYTKVYSVIYDSGSVPRRVIFSPRETSPGSQLNCWPGVLTLRQLADPRH